MAAAPVIKKAGEAATHSTSASSVRKMGRSSGSFASSMKQAAKKKLTLSQLARLIRRLLVVAAAVVYIQVSISACADTFRLLQDNDMPSMDFLLYSSELIGKYAGTKSLRESPMIAALNDDTTPRNGSLFLEEQSTHFTGCSTTATSRIYQDEFQRSIFAAMVSSLAYNLTFLSPNTTELIMPVIDCTFTSLTTGDVTAPRFFYLMRMVHDPEDVFILSVTMGVQEYQVAKQKASGAAAVTTITFINDMRDTEITHYFALALGYPFQSPTFQVFTYYGVTSESFWLLKSVPENPLTEASKIVSTSCPTGYYLSSANEQANIIYLIWHLHQDPLTMLTHWSWVGKSVVRDTWAWVHFLHLYFAVQTILSLLVLLTVMYYNLKNGKIWIGDAFVAVSSTHGLRSILVLLSWYMDEFWALLEFTLHSGNELATTRVTFLYPSIMRADLMSLYISIASIVGRICKERIDPAVTLALFFLGFEARLAITRLFPGMVETLIAYADYEFILGITPLDPSLPELSPLRVWNSKSLPNANAETVCAGLFPIFITLVFVVVYVVARKIYHHFFPDPIQKQRSSVSSIKEKSSSSIVPKSNLTQFEFATGVALLDRFGVVSDYDNYVFFKGMKFASADGIYTSGFVIANGKFLVHIDDLNAILAMKITRIRFKNVYVYEVEGNSVKQTARLVYPETMSFQDILHLNLKILL